MNQHNTQVVEYLTKRRRRKIWQEIVRVLACCVIFCTVYALILPAITQELPTFCEMEVHTHEDACYETQKSLICSAEKLEIHAHSESCLDAEGNQICALADYVAHTHDGSCVDADGNLVCTLQEIQAHVHTDACYEILSEGHIHGADCYETERGELTCQLEELEGHSHAGECYIPGDQLLCTLAEDEGHSHGADCYEISEELTCQTEETEGHAHGTACWQTTEQLLCQTEETAGHSHNTSCYQSVDRLTCTDQSETHEHGGECYAAEEQLVCTVAEMPAHTHGAECYSAVDQLSCTLEEQPAHAHDSACYGEVDHLVCQIEETEGHSHADTCYDQILVCELEEIAGHTHEDACYVCSELLICELEEVEPERNLVCTVPQAAEHIHADGCFEPVAVQTLICDLEENEEHSHAEQCYTHGTLICELEEHEHELICYSDPDADRETASDWEASIANVPLTGVWAEDVLSIAESQLGYQESTKNYTVMEDGETTKGITRYGQWYGIPYGDWCAMFVSFCLNYAEVDGMPLECGCTRWVDALASEKYGLYRDAAEYSPVPGDIIFFDWECDGLSDHVGIVAELIPATEEDAAKIRTIEGNSGNRVQYVTYEADSAVICGYGALPYQPTEEEQAEIDHVIALIDEMPSADEIDTKIAEYETAEDYEGMEVWYADACQQVAKAYHYYSQLTEEQQKLVTNADKLLELEYIWSVTTYSSAINSVAPTTTWYTSTKDFVELNLYDYNGYVNANYWAKNKWYPGFQWNGGAYAKSDYKYSYSSADDGIPDYITDRNYIDSIDFGNSLITNLTYGDTSNYAKSVNATGVGYNDFTQTYQINWLYGNDTEGYTNKPIGTSTTDITNPTQHVMKDTLVDGYPALSDGTMLDYLFKDGTPATKLNTESIDGLFQRDAVTGEYSYNSRTNHAQYSNNFFTLYDQIITPNFITYPFGNFLPLNTISDLSKATQVGAFNRSGGMSDYVERIITDLENNTEGLDSLWKSSQSQLVTMLEEYRENWSIYPRKINNVSNSWTNLSPANAIRDYFWGDTDGKGDQPSSDTDFITQEFLNNMYNIDWDVQTNFFFGMEMKMNFMQPKNGYTGNDTNGDGASDYPMVFYFTGDDDVWVYIDEVLFLDLSGIHRHVGGEIDFVEGEVRYYALDVENGGDVSDTPYKTFSFEEILTAAGKSTSTLNSKGTFADYTTHAFNFYYMERGSGSSVCRLNFNFPLLKKNSITVTKENVTVNSDGTEADTEVLGNPDYYFNIVTPNNELFVGPNSKTGVSTYTILDSAGNEVGTGTVDQYGIFTLKAGQTAVFEGIEENEGKFFVQELIKEADNAQYPDVYVNDQISRYNQLVDWSYRKYFSDGDTDNQTGPYGYKWYGRSGYDTDSSTNSAFYFEQQNHVDVSKLASLTITKNLHTYLAPLAETYYRMYVTLDGAPLAVGTAYTVGSETRTVTEEGIVEIAAGETAVIANIISGTEFEVRETEASAAGYTVTYSQTGADEATTDGSGVSGVVRVNADVSVTITNSEQGATVVIPGSKALAKYDGADHAYTFEMVQVVSPTDLTVIDSFEKQTASAVVKDTESTFDFTITYLQPQLAAENVTLPATYYYKITEAADPTGTSLNDDAVYVAEVTVSEDGDGLTAELTGMYRNGVAVEDKTAAFTNVLTGSLSMSKTVNGSATGQGFEFTITLAPGDSGVDLTGMEFPVTGTNADGTEFTATMGTSLPFTIFHGESLTVSGIPIGVSWTITETDTAGFIPSYEVKSGEITDAGEGNAVSGAIIAGGTNAAFTNTETYVLPETGGAGTTIYTTAGLMLMLIGTAYVLYSKKRGREAN